MGVGVGVRAWLTTRLVRSLTAERHPVGTPLCDFERVRYDIRPGADLLDAGMVFGAGFAPFRGGPMQYVREVGAERLQGLLQNLAVEHGPRFTPDSAWDTAGSSPDGPAIGD